MKKIRIELVNGDVDDETTAKIVDALANVNGRVTAFALTSAELVRDVVRLAELRLASNRVPLADRGGAMMTYRPAGPAARSYKYRAASTEIKLRRGTGKSAVWHLEDVSRVDVYPGASEKILLTITDRAMRNVIKRSLADFGRSTMPADESAEKVAA
jgi:hypothetical protein